MYRCVFTVGIALIISSPDVLTNYSYVNVSPRGSFNTVITHCISGLGPSGNDNGVLGGLYFNGSRIPIAIGCSSQGIIQVAPNSNYAGVIGMHQCEEFSTTAEGVYTCVMLNSSMMNESASVGLYFTGRSESLDYISHHLIVFHLSAHVQLLQ